VHVGSEEYLGRHEVELPRETLRAAALAGRRGASTVFVACAGRTAGWIAYADTPRPEAYGVVQELRSSGVSLIMVTGDQPDVASAVARQIGIDRVEAEVFPERKASIVRELQERGHVVGVVGDGINDSPALAYADVSISLRDSSDIARETADVVLHGDLRGLAEAIDIARHAMRIIHEDLAIVALPNALGFASAALGFMNPTMATALNNGSAVAAALNGLRPLSYRPNANGMHRNGQHDAHEQLRVLAERWMASENEREARVPVAKAAGLRSR
jgi:Cu2+-exporting ATPase